MKTAACGTALSLSTVFSKVTPSKTSMTETSRAYELHSFWERQLYKLFACITKVRAFTEVAWLPLQSVFFLIFIRACCKAVSCLGYLLPSPVLSTSSLLFSCSLCTLPEMTGWKAEKGGHIAALPCWGLPSSPWRWFLGSLFCHRSTSRLHPLGLLSIKVVFLPFSDFRLGRPESLGIGFSLQLFGSEGESQNICAALPHHSVGS